MSLFKHIKSYLEWTEETPLYDEIAKIIVPFGGNTGPYDWMYTPYFRDFVEKLEDESIEVVSLVVPSQIGKTILLLIIAIHWAIKNAVPVYFYMPSMASALELMQNKVIPLITANKNWFVRIEKDENGKPLRSSFKRDIVNFDNGGSLNLLTIGSNQALKGKTSSLVIFDEYAELFEAAPKSLGDPLERALTRTAQFTGRNKKVLVASTPTIADRNIDNTHNMSRQYRYLHKCRTCGEQHEIKYSNIKLEGYEHIKSDIQTLRRAVEAKTKLYWTCECGQKYYEHEKRDMFTRCKWVEVDNTEYDARYVSYNFEAVYGHRTWANLFLTDLAARQDLSKRRTFVNEILAKPWQLFKKSTLKFDQLFKNDVPRGCIGQSKVIATGMDIQKDKMYYSVVGFIETQKVQLIDWGCRPYNNFDELKQIISEIHNESYEGMQNSFTFCDSGFSGTTITRICWEVSKTNCVAIKGTDNRKQFSSVFRHKDHNTKSLDTYHPLRLHDDKTNEELDAYLGEGYLTFPVNFDDTVYFDHLAAEIPTEKKGRTEYVCLSKRNNDYRDTLRYVIFSSLFYKILGKQKRSGLVLFDD